MTHAEALAKLLELDPFREILKREEQKMNDYANALIKRDQEMPQWERELRTGNP